ncbi:MAG TPA: 2-C-methyl-D-erythritol 4-phosphate cytidylyltransferase [Candidatus Aphodousia faecigallinarum]|uniref:2-C-methyl-D-erythritol 4-phosphate cytidylyltransferase n=1 Tax=Candidatus Aphodousia faecigallinarum TaxID=2840677 RepID=A0A9D1LDR5_9BURK|nr:2-C-methyl-D-erythritol 4-phosphate cytidylyltransferase [Candidatus Aphodousia faecigallinarum]
MPKRLLLIPAAGVGERMKIGYPKQYLPLMGEYSMLEVTVNRLSAMELFDQVAVVVSESDAYIDKCRFDSEVSIFRCGGATRAQSVLNGLKALKAEDEDWVFVHDAARPCIDKDSVVRLIESLEDSRIDGAILALKVTDTIKWVNEDYLIEKTIDRSHCYRALTPQVFRSGQLIAALTSADTLVTDEAGAMERSRAKIKVVEGSSINIKVTYPNDIDIVRQNLKALNKKRGIYK